MSRLVSYFKRSLDYLRKETLLQFQGLPTSVPERKKLFEFKTEEDMEGFLIGSDADIGGRSSCYWALKKDGNESNAVFYGDLSTDIPEGSKIDRSGYAAFRSRPLAYTLFHQPMIDVSMYRYLEIKAKGDSRLYMVNITTDSIYPQLIWQHRLYFQKRDEWETIRIPFRDFIKTAHGFVQKKQLAMDKSKIKTIGISLMRQPGPFRLEIESISAVNTSDTLGDFDILKEDEYIDPSTGVLSKFGN